MVGPEAPLADGIVDRFQSEAIPIFGPTRAAARLEASKVFAKELMQKYSIPCAQSVSFTSYEEARKYVEQQGAPIVIKADGLAAGKGVTVAQSLEQALSALNDTMKARVFDRAGDKVVVEEYLTGREVSALAFTDGKTTIPMVPVCDYKPVFDGNKGPNTGGMGSYSPPDFYHPQLATKVKNAIMIPTIKAIAKEQTPYQGVLYCGLIINKDEPKVLEYNARFGDPETQVILPRLKTDLVDIIVAVINGRLDQLKVEWHDEACVAVVMASGGYPGSYQTGFPVSGLDSLDKDITIFHAGTRVGTSGEILTSGGRVLNVVATGKTLTEAREKVYANIQRIKFNGAHYRRDIALASRNREGR